MVTGQVREDQMRAWTVAKFTLAASHLVKAVAAGRVTKLENIRATLIRLPPVRATVQ